VGPDVTSIRLPLKRPTTVSPVRLAQQWRRCATIRRAASAMRPMQSSPRRPSRFGGTHTDASGGTPGEDCAWSQHGPTYADSMAGAISTGVSVAKQYRGGKTSAWPPAIWPFRSAVAAPQPRDRGRVPGG